MNKWFQRNRERAVTESLTMGMQDNLVARETMPLQTVTDEASIALANAAANLAERTAASSTELSQMANEAGETEDGGWTTKVDASSAVQKLALERAKAREAAQARPTATDPASSAFATPDLVSLGTNYDTCRQLTIDGKPFVVSQNGKWACLVRPRSPRPICYELKAWLCCPGITAAIQNRRADSGTYPVVIVVSSESEFYCTIDAATCYCRIPLSKPSRHRNARTAW